MTSLRRVISEAEDLGTSIEIEVNEESHNIMTTPDHATVTEYNTRMDVVIENNGDVIDSTNSVVIVVPESGIMSDVQQQQQVVAASLTLNEISEHNNNNNNNNNNNIVFPIHHHNMMQLLDENTYPTSRLLQNDIPPSIQSLQQQYYSSSSLSGDEDDNENDDDKALVVQDDVLLQQQQQPRLIHSNIVQTITSMGVPSSQPPPQPLPLLLRGNNNNNNINNNGGVVQQNGRGGTGMTRMASASSSSTQSGESSSLKAQSSQNSSRDWGWVDDVHASTTTHSDMLMMMGNTRSSSGVGGGGGGIMTSSSIHPPGIRSAVGGVGVDPMYGHHKNHRVTIVDPMMVLNNNNDDDDNHNMMQHAMAVTAPHYVLEESLSSQYLWKNSAGQRPPQPVEERAFYEKMWAQNFERSNVEYNMPVELLTATSPLSLDPFSDSNLGDTIDYAHHAVGTVSLPMDNSDYHHHGKGTAVTDIAEAALVYRMNDDRNPYGNHHHNNNNDALHNYHSAPMKREVKDTSGDGILTVLVRGDNVFGTTVSKSFARTNVNGDPIAGGVDTINISIASYRVVESPKHGKFAQFLVIYRQGSIRDTIGIWKRYRDFEELAHKVTQAHEGCVAALAHMSPLHTVGDNDNETEHLPNAITSWRLLKKRKRWYRCLDAGYLSLKVFLLERFLHDILFESSSPHLLRDFVGVDM